MNDAAGAATRLILRGIKPFLIASSAIGILAQRLARNVCDRCKKPYAVTPELLKSLNIASGTMTFSHGEGCPACKDSGNYDRRGGARGYAGSWRDSASTALGVRNVKIRRIIRPFSEFRTQKSRPLRCA